MMVRPGPIACAVLSALLSSLAACDRNPKPPPPGADLGPAPAPYKAQKPVVTVLNADQLVIEGKHVRLAGVYAPQPVPDAHCWAEAAAAKLATRQVAGMVEHAASVTYTATGGVDDYERALAKVQIDGADLGEVLVKEGLAARPTKPIARGAFEWCGSISRNEAGAPDVFSMMEMTPGRAPGR